MVLLFAEARMWRAIRVMRRGVDAGLIALATGVTRARAQAYLRRLEAQGFVLCIRPADRKTGAPALYRLRIDPGPHAPGSVEARALAAARAPRKPAKPAARRPFHGPTQFGGVRSGAVT